MRCPSWKEDSGAGKGAGESGVRAQRRVPQLQPSRALPRGRTAGQPDTHLPKQGTL